MNRSSWSPLQQLGVISVVSHCIALSALYLFAYALRTSHPTRSDRPLKLIGDTLHHCLGMKAAVCGPFPRTHVCSRTHGAPLHYLTPLLMHFGVCVYASALLSVCVQRRQPVVGQMCAFIILSIRIADVEGDLFTFGYLMLKDSLGFHYYRLCNVG